MDQNRDYIGIRCSRKTGEIIERIASVEGIPKSKVIRDLLEAGLAARGYVSGKESQTEQMQAALAAVLQPQVERLAAISAKAAHIGAAAFFLCYADLRNQMPPELLPELDELAAKARKLGAEYLKLSKDRNVDQFIQAGLAAMANTTE